MKSRQLKRAITFASNWHPFQCSKINKYEDHFFSVFLSSLKLPLSLEEYALSVASQAMAFFFIPSILKHRKHGQAPVREIM